MPCICINYHGQIAILINMRNYLIIYLTGIRNDMRKKDVNTASLISKFVEYFK
jgi:hypothetical protein